METMYDEIRDTFGAGVTVRGGVWYAQPRVELMCISATGPRGGAPKSVQVLLSLDQARVLCEQVAAASSALQPKAPR